MTADAIAPTANALLQAGAKAHKIGDLRSAEELYQQALDSLGVSSFDAPKDKEIWLLTVAGSLQQGFTDTDVAEIFHLLGALRVQKLVGSAKEEEDDEKPSLQGAAAASLAEAIALRCARASLPSGASDAARARVASSLGTALLHAPKGQEEQRMARAKGSSLEEAVAVLREDRERQGFTDELRALTEALTLLADFMEATEGDKSETWLKRPAAYADVLVPAIGSRCSVGALEYRTPELLAEELAHLKDLTEQHSGGVDLSAKMLEVAKDKAAREYRVDRGYSKLVCGDLVDIFEEGDQVGDLRPALSAASRSLTAHGAVAFSTEEKESKVPEGGYKLAENGGKPVHGHLHLLRKMSTEGSFPFASCDWPAGKMLKLPDACFMET
ncbi:hypothetical protein AK812_SmicGene8355 [Symbiodinium microadriaticum]|uniref:Uncharacterized protein n=1 Tax=Symbiodinium microadriaticum TaxID=2951 RepID=A0A1Q9EL96_SYMMI|nr:hypothetical protein AK812_SmicGene8355 [Symbiodinium microadriaticum]